MDRTPPVWKQEGEMQNSLKMFEGKAEKKSVQESKKMNVFMCVGDSMQLDFVLKGTPARLSCLRWAGIQS